MNYSEISLEKVVGEIGEFYDAARHHFVTVNGIDLGEGKLELQWIFAAYGEVDGVQVFHLVTDFETPIPSIVPLIPSAYLSEMELVDLFGIRIGEQPKGLYLDPDSRPNPLRKES